MYAEPEYKQHKLKVIASESKNGSWEVEVTVSWRAGSVEKRMKYGPYQGFISPVDAQSWAIIRSANWIDSGKSEPSAFVPTPAQIEHQVFTTAHVVSQR